jgi:hypothetical protein
MNKKKEYMVEGQVMYRIMKKQYNVIAWEFVATPKGNSNDSVGNSCKLLREQRCCTATTTNRAYEEELILILFLMRIINERMHMGSGQSGVRHT